MYIYLIHVSKMYIMSQNKGDPTIKKHIYGVKRTKHGTHHQYAYKDLKFI